MSLTVNSKPGTAQGILATDAFMSSRIDYVIGNNCHAEIQHIHMAQGPPSIEDMYARMKYESVAVRPESYTLTNTWTIERDDVK